ncbi:DJ-1 family glyoxalase III [Luteolibacter algae]|uniref:DJ-1 family glyoxalase III n=1 Tax=Luteolibacter algae TaxID=454151 RepID=A0ABW5D2A7_9BACT
MKRVLCILENGFEEIEMVTPVDLLRRAGVEVVLAGVSGMELTGRSGITVKADSLFSEVAGERFDALFLPGGPAVMELRKQEDVVALIRAFHESGLLIAAICAAPLLLKDAGLVDGKRITAHFSTEDELPGNTGERLIYDGEFLTSRGAGTALDFGFEFVRILVGKEAADSVSEAVMT